MANRLWGKAPALCKMQKLERLLGGFKGAVGFEELSAAIAGGLLMGLAPAPLNLWPLAWIALVPLWVGLASPLGCRVWGIECRERAADVAIKNKPSQQTPLSSPTPHTPHPTPLKKGAILGLAWGIGYHGLALFWITGIHPMTWMGVPWLASAAIALFCWLFITLWGAALVAIWAAVFSLSPLSPINLLHKSKKPPFQRGVGGIFLNYARGLINRAKHPDSRLSVDSKNFPQDAVAPTINRAKHPDSRLSVDSKNFPQDASPLQNSLSRVLMATALWCVLEAIWSIGPLWWSSLSYTQSPHNPVILHLSQLSGPSVVTAAIVAVNGFIAEAWIAWQNSRAKLASDSPAPNSVGCAMHTKAAAMGKSCSQESLGQSPGGVNSETNQKAPRANFSQTPLIPLGKKAANYASFQEWVLTHFRKLGGGLEPPPGRANYLQSLAIFYQNSISLFLLALFFFVSSHLLGFCLYSRPLSQLPENQLKIGIVQGNIPNEIKLDPEGWSRALAGYARGYRQLASQGVNAVLTPETALPYLWTVENRRSSFFYQAILEKNIVAWVGSFGTKGRSFTNSLFTVTGDGETFSRYDKTNLVPLGEYIPFENLLGNIINRLSPLDAHLVAGARNQIFDTPFGRAIAGICFDSPFAEHFRYQAAAGGQFILSVANDAHYSSDIMAQHHALDLMRAIETDRWAARATNTGFSAIVDPHGKTRWISGINTYELYAGNIYRRESKTLYVRWGDRLTPLLFFFALLVWFRTFLK